MLVFLENIPWKSGLLLPAKTKWLHINFKKKKILWIRSRGFIVHYLDVIINSSIIIIICIVITTHLTASFGLNSGSFFLMYQQKANRFTTTSSMFIQVWHLQTVICMSKYTPCCNVKWHHTKYRSNMAESENTWI